MIMEIRKLVAVLLIIFFSSFSLYITKTLTQNPTKIGYFIQQSSLNQMLLIVSFVVVLGLIGIYFYVKSSGSLYA